MEITLELEELLLLVAQMHEVDGGLDEAEVSIFTPGPDGERVNTILPPSSKMIFRTK